MIVGTCPGDTDAAAVTIERNARSAAIDEAAPDVAPHDRIQARQVLLPPAAS